MRRTLVNDSNFDEALDYLCGCVELALDTEGTGLRPYHGDKFFSIIIGDDRESFYFNFQDYQDQIIPVLTSTHIDKMVERLFSLEKNWILQNYKYDAAVLRREGVVLKGFIHDTMIAHRVIDSTARRFDMGSIGERYGYSKNDQVEKEIKDRKLYVKKSVPGKKTKAVFKFYDQVRPTTIIPYGHDDQITTFKIYKKQIEELEKLHTEQPEGVASIWNVYHNEMMLLKVIEKMENRGVGVDVDFCKRAIAHEVSRREKATAEFEKITGYGYVSSRKLFEKVFDTDKENWEYGEPTKVKKEVNPKFEESTLKTFKNPAAKLVLTIRDSKAQEDQYRSLMYHTDATGVIHTNFNQHLPTTGRFSSSEPNLQNMKKDANVQDKEFTVRRAIVPKEGNFLGMIDFDQVEYRLLLNYCKAKGIIKKIKEEGLDVHGAMAQKAALTRAEAKTVNFASLYGSGLESLSKTMGCSQADAKLVLSAIDDAAPEISPWKNRVKKAVTNRGCVYTWMGRKLDFPLVYDSVRQRMTRNEYRSINHLIQGGCADVIKKAMVQVDTFLETSGVETRMKLTIHDELVFEGPRGEEWVLEEIKKIMESAYGNADLPLTAGIDISYRSLADKEQYYG